MTPRERIMAFAVLGVLVVVAGGFLFQQLLLGPLGERGDDIARLQADNEKKLARIAQVRADKPKFDRWKALSLPADADLATREYEKYLGDLMRKSRVTSLSITAKKNDPKSSPQVLGKGPIYTKLTFTVAARADLGHLVWMLEDFYRTSLLHQIRHLSIQRPLTLTQQQRQGDLDINLTIDALIVTGVDNRPNLVPGFDRRLFAIDTAMALRGGPVGLAFAAWAAGPTGRVGPGTLAQPTRNYASIAGTGKNIFMGRPPERERLDLDFTQFVRLTTISNDGKRTEAYLYDRFKGGREQRVRAEGGFNQITVRDTEGEAVVTVKVVRINQEEGEIILLVDEKYYALRIGDDLSVALRKPLSAERTKALGLVTAAAPAAKEEKDQ